MEIFVEQATHSKLMLMSKVRIGNHAQADMQKFFLLGTARVVHNNGLKGHLSYNKLIYYCISPSSMEVRGLRVCINLQYWHSIIARHEENSCIKKISICKWEDATSVIPWSSEVQAQNWVNLIIIISPLYKDNYNNSCQATCDSGSISAVSWVPSLILSFYQTAAGNRAYHTIRKRFSHIVIIS